MSRTRNDDDLDLVLYILFFVSVVVFFGGLAAQFGEAVAHNDCHNSGELVQIDVTYRKWDGCFVNHSGTWVPLEVWKYNRDHSIDMSKITE